MSDKRFYDMLGPLSLTDIVDGLDIQAVPQKFLDENIISAADLLGSKPGQISFLGSKKDLPRLDKAQATACFVTEAHAAQVGEKNIIPLISKTPKAHFGRAISRLVAQKSILGEMGADPVIAASAKIHPTAIIGFGAVIGNNVEIGPYSVIGPGVTIGVGTHIANNVTVECSVLGQNCQIKANACIGTSGFGMSADENGICNLPHIGRVIMGDRVSIGCHSTVDRGFIGDTVIGNDVKVDNLVQIAHNCQVGDGTMMAGHVGISGSCVIGKNVLLGGSVGLADHIHVGDGARLAARAGVMHDVPAGETWSGIPAMPIRDHMRVISATRKLVQKKPKNQ